MMTERRSNKPNDRRLNTSNTQSTTFNRRSKYAPKDRRIKNNTRFTEQDITLADTPLFFPEGFEKLFLGLYFVSLPYITGLLFLFFYIAEGKPELFLSLNEDSSFLLTWAIGYEIIAFFTLLYIIKMAFEFTKEVNNSPRQFKKP